MRSRTAIRCLALVACFALLATGPVLATEASGSEAPLSTRLQALVEALDFALYLSKAAIISLSPSDAQVHLARLEKHLVGDADVEIAGMIGTFAAVRRYIESLAQEYDEAASAADALSYAEQFLSLSLDHVRSALLDDGTLDTITREAAEAYALLLAARGDAESPFAMDGLLGALDALPNAEIVLGPQDSLPSALDRVLPGGTLVLEPGTYHMSESVRIRKSLTLRGATGNREDIVLVMEDAEESAVVVGAIGNQDSLDVRLADLTIIGGRTNVSVAVDRGVSAGGEHRVSLENVDLRDATMAALYAMNGTTTVADSTLERAEQFGVAALHKAFVQLSNCRIEANGTPEIMDLPYATTSGVLAGDRANVELLACVVTSSAGTGIFGRDDSRLSLIGCSIHKSELDGILLWDRADLLMERCDVTSNRGWGLRAHAADCSAGDEQTFSSHYHTGSITGSSNRIAASEGDGANQRGATCPFDLADKLAW